MKIGEYSTHPAADVFPLLEGAEFDALCADIKENGLLHPIVRMVQGDEVTILDGRNRLRACLHEGVEPKWHDYTGNDPAGYVISENLHRRHLDESQRALAAARLARLKHGGRPGRGRASKDQAANLPTLTQKEAASRFNVSERSIRTAGNLLDKVQSGKAAPEVLELIEQGKVTVSAASPLAKQPLEEQRSVIVELRRGKSLPAVLRDHRNERAKQMLAERVREGKRAKKAEYDAIVVDPPWTKGQREVIDTLQKLDLPAAEDCHMWLWAPATSMEAAFELLRRWGFEFVCPFVWHKQDGLQPPGMPQYNCELALYARRGNAQFVDVGEVQTCFTAGAGRRGAKPVAFYALVKKLTGEAARRLDLFASRAPEGFDAGSANEHAA